VYGKSLGMRHFRFSVARIKQNLPPSWGYWGRSDGNDEKTALTEAVGCIIDRCQEAKMEILARGVVCESFRSQPPCC
jgi:hypothetical protein